MRLPSHKNRHAFTLMELVLVLAIIVIAAAISVPVLGTLLADTRITASGDAVRGKLAETRARAIEDGVAWRFAFLPNTGVYQLAPEDSSDWDNPSSELIEKADLLRDSLPKDVVFSLTHEGILGQQQALPAGDTWETIAVFLPDGSARDDATVHFGKPGLAPMRVQVRGLTGTVELNVFSPNTVGQRP